MDFSESDSILEEGPFQERNSDVSGEKNTFLCLSWTAGKLGAACYDSETCVLRIFDDKQESAPDFYVTKILCQQIEPTNVIVSSKSDGEWINAIKDYIQKDNGFNLDTEHDSDKNIDISLIPNKDFVFEGGQKRLEMINLPQIPKLASKTERTMFFSSYFNYENINAIKSSGALLKNLDKMRINIQLEDDNVMVPILAIDVINLEELVFIDTKTYRVLQIFHQLNHPSTYKTSCKEGLSLYSILNRCRTTMGSKEMRKYFLRPTKDAEILEERLNAVEFFNQFQSLEVTTALENHVKNISDVLRILKRMRGSQLTIKEWETLYKTMYSAMIIADIVRPLPKNIVIFKKIREKCTTDLYRIATVIQKTVNFEEGVKQQGFCVKQGIDANLDEKKRLYVGLPDVMGIIAKQELENLPDHFTSCTVMYLPRLGYMLALKETPQLIENDRQLPNLHFLFSSEGVSHYKSVRTSELDVQLGDTHYEIRDRENVILDGLQTLILELSQTIYDTVDCCAQLDCLLAFASVAREYNYVKPKILREPGFEIINSRHPLQERRVSTFVENDVISGGTEKTQITIITGPNASGKSVYLKQIGLLAFMSHIGSFVPAESAEIGLVDAIFTQIHFNESVSNPLSSFLLDLNQIALGIRNSTSNSLMIIDEFGQGTDESDGLALLASIVNYWIRNPFLSPLTFVSTHFHSLKNLLEISNVVKYKTMEVYSNEGENTFLYNLIDGIADKSYAHRIAAKAGIPNVMIRRSLQISEILVDPKAIPAPVITESYRKKAKECEDICAALIEFHVETGDLTDLYKACEINHLESDPSDIPPPRGNNRTKLGNVDEEESSTY